MQRTLSVYDGDYGQNSRKRSCGEENRTPEEDDMLDMILHGGERVKFADLKQVLDWYKNWRNMDDDER